MKKIEAVVPHARLGNAFAALKELDLGGLTYYDSKGRGQNPTPELHSGRGTSTYRPEFNVNATIDATPSIANPTDNRQLLLYLNKRLKL